MLRNLILAASLLVASGSALAWDGYNRSYGHVVSVEPHFVLSFGGGRHHDGFRVLYEVSGTRYWTHSHHHPGHTILVPSYRAYDNYSEHRGRGHHGWNRSSDRHDHRHRGHRGHD
ncbi:MAG: hypothetical protein ABL877_10705 [Thiobacillus sp.]